MYWLVGKRSGNNQFEPFKEPIIRGPKFTSYKTDLQSRYSGVVTSHTELLTWKVYFNKKISKNRKLQTNTKLVTRFVKATTPTGRCISV